MEFTPMRLLCFVVLLAAWSELYRPREVAKAADTKVAELIGIAPTVRSSDRGRHCIKLLSTTTASSYGQLSFLAMYQAPDRFFLCIADGHDGTPIVYLCDNHLLAYNAIEGRLLYLSNARFDYAFGMKSGIFSQTCEVMKSGEPSKILVDVRSLYERKAKRDDLTENNGGGFRLSRTLGDGKSFVAIIDPSRRCPFTRLELSEAGSEVPLLLVRELSVDEDVRDPWPLFPPKSRWAGLLAIEDLSIDTLPNNLAISEFMQRCLCARAAVAKESLREAYQLHFGGQTDWSKVELIDREMSREIRRVLGTPIKPESGK
jgi:hypothetical protein